jgi:hypothetical protein
VAALMLVFGLVVDPTGGPTVLVRQAFFDPITADSDDAAMSFRDHAASYSGMIPPPLGGAFQRSDVDDFSGSGQA